MILIDKTYFEDADMLVAGLGQNVNVKKLNELIAKYERQYLKNILGYAFYKAFQSAMDDEAESETLATKWKELRDGGEYTDSTGVLRKWEGLINNDLTSPIANYIYYWYLRKNASRTTVRGEKSDKQPTSDSSSSINKQVRAWNEMVRMSCSLVDFLLNKKEDGEKVYTDFKTEELTPEFYNLLEPIGHL